MTSLAELGEISKASKRKKEDYPREPPKGYRESYLSAVNPVSQTYVKEGTGSAARRVVGPWAAGMGGSYLGAVAGAASARKDPVKAFTRAKTGAALGGFGGLSAGLHRNIRSKDTISYHKGSGKKAKGKVGYGIFHANLY